MPPIMDTRSGATTLAQHGDHVMRPFHNLSHPKVRVALAHEAISIHLDDHLLQHAHKPVDPTIATAGNGGSGGDPTGPVTPPHPVSVPENKLPPTGAKVLPAAAKISVPPPAVPGLSSDSLVLQRGGVALT